MNCPQCQSLWYKTLKNGTIEVKTRNHNMIVVEAPSNITVQCKCGFKSYQSGEILASK